MVLGRNNRDDEEESSENDEKPEYKREAGVPALDDVNDTGNIMDFVKSVKWARKAKGEIEGLKASVKAVREKENGEFVWKTRIRFSRTIEERYDERLEQYIESDSINMTSEKPHNSAIEAYNRFEKLVEEYDLKEITNTEKSPFPEKEEE